MVTVSNFITELIEESFAKDAPKIVFASGMPPQLLINGRLLQFGQTLDMEELEEDMEALGIPVGITDTFYYFHPIDEHFVYKVRVFVKVAPGGKLHNVTMNLLDEISRTEMNQVITQ